MQGRQAPFTYLTFSYAKLFSVDKTESNGIYNIIKSIKNYACMPLPMYGKFFIILAVIAFTATTIDVTTAFGQNQTSNLTTLSTPVNNTMTTANITTTAFPNMTLDDAREQYLSIWNQTEFNATFSTFIEPFSAAGYGVYEERSNVFAPGETIVLYVEPVGFDHKQILDDQGNTQQYLMNFTADFLIADNAPPTTGSAALPEDANSIQPLPPQQPQEQQPQRLVEEQLPTTEESSS